MLIRSLADGLRPDAEVADSLNTCTTCGICTASCPASVNPPRIIESARRQMVSRGFVTKAQARLRERLQESKNTFGDGGDRTAWLKDRSALGRRADLVYFAGCMNSYRRPQTAANTFALLSRFGAGLLPAEQCCGSPLLRMGLDASSLIGANVLQMKEIGARAIVTGCAGCYTTLKNNYPADFQVLSVPEFLAEHISELSLRPLDLVVTYHDPCHLGRQNGVYDAPRRVIRAICDLVEMKTCRQEARCCGGGGGVRAGYAELSLKMARKRLDEVPKGVDYIVTSCPLCIRNLGDAGAGKNVIDLADLVAMAAATKAGSKE